MFNLIYVVSGFNSAFNSQVGEYLNSLCSSSSCSSITLFVGYKKERQSLNYLDKKVNIIWFKTYYEYPFFIKLSTLSLRKRLRLVSIENDTIIHVRGDYAAYLFTEATNNLYNAQVLVDVRATPFESKFYLFSKVKTYLKTLFINKFTKIYQKEVYYTAVSDSLKEHLIKDFKVQRERITVIPCIAGGHFCYNPVRRSEIRQELGLSQSDILFIFSTGAEVAWQKTEDIIKLVKDIHSNIKILILSNRRYNYENVISMKVNYSEVPYYLNAADIGIIVRDRNIVNKIACPIKFIEYQAVGLPVVANDAIDFITGFITSNSSGSIFTDQQEINYQSVSKLLLLDRNSISTIAKAHFDIKTIHQKYVSLYLKICHHKSLTNA